ncbi:MAG: hypothetical protein ABFC62_11575, partial [Clostridiaceae bacterium]
ISTISTTPRSIFPRVSIISPSYILPLISQKAQSLLDFFDKLSRARPFGRARLWHSLAKQIFWSSSAAS